METVLKDREDLRIAALKRKLRSMKKLEPEAVQECPSKVQKPKDEVVKNDVGGNQP